MADKSRAEGTSTKRQGRRSPQFSLLQVLRKLKQDRSTFDSRLSAAENLVLPIVRMAWEELTDTVSQSSLGILSDQSARALRKGLLLRLVSTGEQAIDFTWHAFITTPGLSPKGGSPALLSEFFADGVETELYTLLRNYPALGPLWVEQARMWCGFIGEFLIRANRFAQQRHWPKISIRAIRPDCSDLHTGNRCVIRAHFEQGGIWFYKPRSGQKEEAFFALLKQLNRLGFSAPFRTPEIVCEKMHCWMRAVGRRHCSDLKETKDYFYRAGAILYLVYVLRGVDFHAGNVIASGAQPVVIDCETLLHPSTKVPREFRAQQDTILALGFLPVAKDDGVSALGRLEAGPHLVPYGGKYMSPADFQENLIGGFWEAHNLFSRGRSSPAFTKILAALGGTPSRVIYRPTVHYHQLLRWSLQSTLLQSKSIRRSFLRDHCRAVYLTSAQSTLEARMLEHADIPLFQTPSQRPRDLSTQEATKAADIIRRSLSG